MTVGWKSQCLTGYWEEASVPYHVDISVGLLERQLASLRVSELRERKRERNQNVFYDLDFEVAYYHFCIPLVTQINPED